MYFYGQKLKDGKYVSLNNTPSAQTSNLLTPLALRSSKNLIPLLLFSFGRHLFTFSARKSFSTSSIHLDLSRYSLHWRLSRPQNRFGRDAKYAYIMCTDYCICNCFSQM
jgi:hypothetical protein